MNILIILLICTLLLTLITGTVCAVIWEGLPLDMRINDHYLVWGNALLISIIIELIGFIIVAIIMPTTLSYIGIGMWIIVLIICILDRRSVLKFKKAVEAEEEEV